MTEFLKNLSQQTDVRPVMEHFGEFMFSGKSQSSKTEKEKISDVVKRDIKAIFLQNLKPELEEKLKPLYVKVASDSTVEDEPNSKNQIQSPPPTASKKAWISNENDSGTWSSKAFGSPLKTEKETSFSEVVSKQATTPKTYIQPDISGFTQTKQQENCEKIIEMQKA